MGKKNSYYNTGKCCNEYIGDICDCPQCDNCLSEYPGDRECACSVCKSVCVQENTQDKGNGDISVFDNYVFFIICIFAIFLSSYSLQREVQE